MKVQLRNITRRFRIVARRLAQREMREQIDHYFATGEEPQGELARAYLDQIRSFNELSDSSVGGQDHARAKSRYEEACSKFEALRKGM